MAEFWEKITYYLQKTKANMGVLWKYGVFLGRALASDLNFIALSDGSVTRARAMVRMIPSARWELARINAIQTTP